MVNNSRERTELIWYNPHTACYECGVWVRFKNLTSEWGEEGFSILYETDDLTSRLANKIVNELNAARGENNHTEVVVAYA